MVDKYIKEFSEATTPNSTDALLIDQGLGAYKYCQIANLLKGVNISGMGTLGCGAITSSGTITFPVTGFGVMKSGATAKSYWINGTQSGLGGADDIFFTSEAGNVALKAGSSELKLTYNGGATFTNKIETTSTASDSIKTAGGVSVAGDIYTTAWTDYSDTSTIVGFSGVLTAKVLRYKKVGKLVFVSFNLGGTSNTNRITFTLPFTSVNTDCFFGNALIGTIDNGSQTATPGRVVLPPNSATAIVDKDFSGTGTFTTSGQKDGTGSFWYEAQ
jgi:hypothetical protein